MITWVASYPRSGNTFARILLQNALGIDSYSLYGDVKDIAPNKRTADLVGHKSLPRGFSIEKARAAKRRYVIKTHELSPNTQDHAIYIIRDGRECMWSYQNYLADFWDVQPTMLDLIRGNVDFGRWVDHVRSWHPSHRPNTLLVHFHEMVNSPKETVDRFAAFLHARPRAYDPATFQQLHKINPQMFRAGRPDDWRTHMPAKLEAEFWQGSGEIMQEFGYARNRT